MKVLLHSDKMELIDKSGLGQAINHQKEALQRVGIDYTTDPLEEYDIIHINTIFPESYMMSKKAKKLGKKVVFHAHSTEEDFKNSFLLSNQVAPLFKVWLKKCYSTADVILTPTPYSKRLLDNYDLGKPIIAISNGINLDVFKRNEEAGQKWRRDMGFQDTDKVIISIGLYIERKGILDFVELAKRMPQYHFVWIGFSNLNLTPSKIRDAVNTKLDNLHFPGYLPRETVMAALSGADLYLYLTFEETEGLPAIEASACKQNILLRDIPIYEGMFEEGVNAYKAKTLEQFEEKITGILEGKLPYLGEAAYQVAKERDIKEIGKQLKEIYEEVIKEEVQN